MGGFGSGRHWQWGSKASTAEMRSLDVRRLARDNLLTPGRSFTWRWTLNGEPFGNIVIYAENNAIRLHYRVSDSDGEHDEMNYQVRLLSTGCHLGGRRRWFACPAANCGRRVAIIYGGRVFACRHCHRLAYPSQRESPYLRHQRRADKIRHRLGWENAEDEYLLGKPKGMHWRTYHRMVDEMARWDYASNIAFTEYFNDRFGALYAE